MKMRIYFFAAFASLLALLGCDSSQGSKGHSSESKSYTLTERERVVFKNILIREIDVVAEEGDGSPVLIQKLLGEYVAATSDKLQKTYEKNEVAADQRFRKKTILTNGTVQSIDRGVGENYFISLKGGSNMFMQPKAAMADGYTDFLASLKKGDRAWLVCQGNGMLMGSAMLSKCEPLIDFSSKVATKFLDKLNVGKLAASPDATNSTILMFSVMSVAAASSLPESSVCFSGKNYEAKCVAEISRFFNAKGKAKEEEYKNAIQSAGKKIGVDVDMLKASLK